MEFCKHGIDGDCCCNCNNQTTLYKIPTNTGKYYGQMSEETGLYSCDVIFLESDEENRAILFDHKHGMCEMYERMA